MCWWIQMIMMTPMWWLITWKKKTKYLSTPRNSYSAISFLPKDLSLCNLYHLKGYGIVYNSYIHVLEKILMNIAEKNEKHRRYVFFYHPNIIFTFVLLTIVLFIYYIAFYWYIWIGNFISFKMVYTFTKIRWIISEWEQV